MESANKIATQTLAYKEKSDISIAQRYFTILSEMNSLELTPMEINILSFTLVRGTITPPSARRDFVKMFDSSEASLGNVKGILTKKKLLVKVDGMYRVNPRLRVDVSNGLVLKIIITKDGDKQDDTNRES